MFVRIVVTVYLVQLHIRACFNIYGVGKWRIPYAVKYTIQWNPLGLVKIPSGKGRVILHIITQFHN